MATGQPLILGEFRRTVDDRFRLSVPTELLELMRDADEGCVLVKERPGALSLWQAARWRSQLAGAVQVLEAKWQSGRLNNRLHDLQDVGRLLSTRHRDVQLAGRGRLVIPEGFREFLGVEAGHDVMLVGAAVCIEISASHTLAGTVGAADARIWSIAGGPDRVMRVRRRVDGNESEPRGRT